MPNIQRGMPFAFGMLPLAFGVLILCLWYFATRGESAATLIIASPLDVARQAAASLLNGSLINHTITSLLEILFGFSVGVGAAFLLGYGIARNSLLEQIIGPYAVGFQAVPMIAIAPVLIYFFGTGIVPNGTIGAIIVFFPMLITTIVAIRSVDPDLRDLMRSLHATRWQTFVHLELPAALPVLFGGLKISTTLAVAGAIVSEAVSSESGLGYLIYSARYTYDKALMWVGVFTLVGLALLLYEIVARLERHLLKWQRSSR